MYGLSEHFLGSVSEHLLSGFIGETDPALGIHAENAFAHRMQIRLKLSSDCLSFAVSLLHNVFQMRFVTRQFCFGLFRFLGALLTGLSLLWL